MKSCTTICNLYRKYSQKFQPSILKRSLENYLVFLKMFQTDIQTAISKVVSLNIIVFKVIFSSFKLSSTMNVFNPLKIEYIKDE